MNETNQNFPRDGASLHHDIYAELERARAWQMRSQLSVSDDERRAIEQLLDVAGKHTDQGRHVAEFLLSWWNADDWGGFDPRNLWAVDADQSSAMLTVLGLIQRKQSYPDALGFEVAFEHLCSCWPTLKKGRRKSVQ